MKKTGISSPELVIAAVASGVFLCFASVTLAQTASRPADASGAQARRVPLIYQSDLFHPHDDPDDHFDLATVFAMPELDVKAILLDLGDRQEKKPGRIPLQQMFRLTGREAPFAIGLSDKLRSPDDKALDQPAANQAAVELFLRTLRESPEPVVVVTAGSLRDTCAAFNRDPALFRAKIGKIYINLGNLTENEGEWNEMLDPQSYIGIMRSGLPICWCPCRPTGQNRTSFWKFKHAEILDGLPQPLLNYFIYALQVVSPNEIDPMAALDMDLRPWRHILMGQERSMWCTSSLIHAAGRKVYRVGDHWVAAAAAPAGGQLQEVFTFAPAHVDIEDVKGRAYTKCQEGDKDANMQVYKVLDAENHQAALKSCLRDMFMNFPLKAKTPG